MTPLNVLIWLCSCQLTLTSVSRPGASGIRGYIPTARMQPSRRASTCLLQRNFGFAVTCCHQVRNVHVGVQWCPHMALVARKSIVFSMILRIHSSMILAPIFGPTHIFDIYLIISVLCRCRGPRTGSPCVVDGGKPSTMGRPPPTASHGLRRPPTPRMSLQVSSGLGRCCTTALANAA